MRHPIIAGIMGLALAIPAQAGDVFSLRITAHPTVTVRGVPVEILGEIRNVSEHPVTTGTASPMYGYAEGYFSVFARAEGANGTAVAPCKNYHANFQFDAMVVAPESPAELAADWRRRFKVPLCIDKVGVYKVALVARGQGPFIDRFTSKEFEIWSGEVASAPITIEIEEPAGVDREAFDYFKGRPLADTMQLGELLQKFPTSTYAAYVIFIQAGPPEINPVDEKGLSILLAELRTGSLLTNSYPDDSGTSKRGWRSLSGEAAASWLARWYEIVLNNHPDLWFADELKLKRALDQLALHNVAEGQAQLAALAKSGRPEIAEKAGQLLALVKQKGLVK